MLILSLVKLLNLTTNLLAKFFRTLSVNIVKSFVIIQVCIGPRGSG